MKLNMHNVIASAILCTALLVSFCNAYPYPVYWDREAFLEQLQQEELVGAEVEIPNREAGRCTFDCPLGSIFATNDSQKSIRRSPNQSKIDYPCQSTPSIPIGGTIYDVILDCFTKCPELSILHGVVEYRGIDNKLEPRDPDTTATYSCSGGYKLRGNSTRNCNKEGEWSGEAPKCIPLCPIPSLPNGLVTYEFGHRKHGDVAFYSCKSRYRLNGPEKRTCRQNGTWSGEEPVCEVIICPLVNSIPNGDSSSSRSPIRGPGGSQGFGKGTVVTYTCDTNFELRGESTRTCLESGEWNRPEPRCAETNLKCPKLNSSDIPKNVPEADDKLKNHPNYRQLRYTPYYNRMIEGDRSEGSMAYLECKNGWELLKGTPANQTCISVNGKLDWTKAGTCVFYYSYIKHG